MTCEVLQNPYFVRLFCIWILTKHISNCNIVINRSFDKIKILWALKFKKKGGGEPLWKRGGGGTDPLFPPPLNPPLSSMTYFLLNLFIPVIYIPFCCYIHIYNYTINFLLLITLYDMTYLIFIVCIFNVFQGWLHAKTFNKIR